MVKFNICLSPRTVAKYLIIIASILSVLSLAIAFSTYTINFYEEWMDMLDLDKEMNIPTWFSVFLLASCAFASALVARGKQIDSARYYRHWKMLSYLFWFMAVDEAFSLHEVLIIPEIAQALNLPWFLHSMWVIPGMIFVGWAIKYFWKFAVSLPKKTRDRMFLAAALYFGGSLGMEMIGSYYAEWKTQQDIIYVTIANLEEILEMSGTILFLKTILFYLGQSTPKIQIQLEIFNDRSAM
jgi:hypothetical protein